MDLHKPAVSGLNLSGNKENSQIEEVEPYLNTAKCHKFQSLWRECTAYTCRLPSGESLQNLNTSIESIYKRYVQGCQRKTDGFKGTKDSR